MTRDHSRLDMGNAEALSARYWRMRELLPHLAVIGVDYEGEHHWRTRREFARGIRRHDTVTGLGWIDVRVTAEDTDASVVEWVRRARKRRT